MLRSAAIVPIKRRLREWVLCDSLRHNFPALRGGAGNERPDDDEHDCCASFFLHSFFLCVSSTSSTSSFSMASGLTETAPAGSLSDPFPPSYSTGPFTWATPLFISPTTLLSIITLFALGRYLQTRTNPWVDSSSGLDSRQRRLSSLSKLIIAIALTVTVTFLADAAILVTRALVDGHWTSSVLAYYIAVSWLAWVVNFVSLTDEVYKFGDWTWVQYAFWMTAALCDTLVGWLWLVALLRPRPGTFALILLSCLSLFLLVHIFTVRYYL